LNETRKSDRAVNEKIPKRIGLYDISEVLGQGGMSTVYKGIQPSLNRPVAIKVLPLHMAREQELIDRFERESSIIAGLNHPNIIQIIDRGADEGRYFIVMEYVEGTSLDAIIHERSLPIGESVLRFEEIQFL
jgi:serine/threonine-protein kinase